MNARHLRRSECQSDLTVAIRRALSSAEAAFGAIDIVVFVAARVGGDID